MTHLRARGVVILVGLVLGAATVAGCSSDKKLKVTGLDPQQGDYTGGTTVHFTGNGFLLDDGSPRLAKVYFGSREGTVIRFDGDKDLYVSAPGGDKGKSVDILIRFDPGGEITIHDKFKFVETSNAGVGDLNTSGSGK